MNVANFNDTKEGKAQLAKVFALQTQIDEICSRVRQATDETSDGAYIEWDDGGFYENKDI